MFNEPWTYVNHDEYCDHCECRLTQYTGTNYYKQVFEYTVCDKCYEKEHDSSHSEQE